VAAAGAEDAGVVFEVCAHTVRLGNKTAIAVRIIRFMRPPILYKISFYYIQFYYIQRKTVRALRVSA
jgi:hypothetical protein